ncbi:MAG TPA: sulfite exporter TauE/SafE family protein [Rhizobiales bacterium]|nr:sulfite exporter TauE/SafE family protein [Hyphomicrobiales bacterium]
MPEIQMSAGEIAVFAAAAALAGAISGLLAGIFGIGGGAVLVPVFYQFLTALGIDESVRMHLAVGTSLAIIIPTSIRSFAAHRARGAVDMELLKSFLIPVPAGVVAASLIAASVSSSQLRAIFAGIVLLLGLRLIFNRDNWVLGSEVPGNPLRAVVGFVIGLLSTLMGIGGGIMNNTFMTLYGRPIHQAVATSSGVGVLIAIPGAVGLMWAGWGNPFLPIASTGYVNWIAVALIIPIALIVTPSGVRISHWLSRRHLEIAFGLFCLFVAVRFFVSLT